MNLQLGQQPTLLGRAGSLTHPGGSVGADIVLTAIWTSQREPWSEKSVSTSRA